MSFNKNLTRTIAVFDIDGTITVNNTFFSFIRFFLKRERKIKYFIFIILSSNFFKVFWFLYSQFCSFEFYRHICIWFLRGAAEAEVSKAAADFINSLKSEDYIEPTLQLISDFQKQKIDIILVSGTLCYLAESLADHLGAKSAIGFLPDLEDNRLTGKIKSDPRGRKDVFIRPFLAGRELFFVTDNKEDMPLVLLANKAWVVSKNKNVNWWTSRVEQLTIVKSEL